MGIGSNAASFLSGIILFAYNYLASRIETSLLCNDRMELLSPRVVYFIYKWMSIGKSED